MTSEKEEQVDNKSDKPEGAIPFGKRYSPETMRVVENTDQRALIVDSLGRTLVKERRPIGFKNQFDNLINTP